MVDLRDCREGDKLRSKHGEVLTYIRPLEEGSYYDHLVRYANGAFGTRTHNGQTFRNKRMDEDHDIVEIIKEV